MWAQVGTAPSGALINTKSTAFNPANGKTYVLDDLGEAIWVFSASESSPKKVDLGGGPSAVVVSESTGRVYATLKATGEVVVINGTNSTVSARLKVGPHPYTLAIDDRRHRVYVGATSNDVFATIDSNTLKVELQAGFGAEDQLAVNANTGTVFAIEYGNPNLKIYHPDTKRTTLVNVGEHLWGLAVSGQTETAYLTRTTADELVAVNERTREKRAVHVGKIPCAIAIDDQQQRVLVLNYGDNSLSILDTRTLSLLSTVPVGGRPQAILLDAKSKTVYVANLGDNSVSRISEAAGKVVNTMPAGAHPYGIEFSADPNVLYAADLGTPAWNAIRFRSSRYTAPRKIRSNR